MMSQNTSTTSEKRTVYAPVSMSGGSSPVLSVRLEENEEVDWQWTHYADGRSVVTGYEIINKNEGEEAFDIKRAISDWLWDGDEDKKYDPSAA